RRSEDVYLREGLRDLAFADQRVAHLCAELCGVVVAVDARSLSAEDIHQGLSKWSSRYGTGSATAPCTVPTPSPNQMAMTFERHRHSTCLCQNDSEPGFRTRPYRRRPAWPEPSCLPESRRSGLRL